MRAAKIIGIAVKTAQSENWRPNVQRFTKPVFDLPRGICRYPYRFCCGPLDFSDMGPKIVCIITRNPVFDNLFLSKDLFRHLV